jgi:hypothetical protein
MPPSRQAFGKTGTPIVAARPSGGLTPGPAAAGRRLPAPSGRLSRPSPTLQSARPPTAGLAASSPRAPARFNQGSFNSGIISNADALYVSVSGNKTTFNFEPYVVATTMDDCKNGGWQNAKRADGTSFKNQGDCVSYTNTGR